MRRFRSPTTRSVRWRQRSRCTLRRREVNERWEARGLPPFFLGIGLSTGDVAAALLGSEERLEYSVVGDAVNLAQRLQQWGEGGQTVLSEPTYDALVGQTRCGADRAGARQGTSHAGRRVPHRIAVA